MFISLLSLFVSSLKTQQQNPDRNVRGRPTQIAAKGVAKPRIWGGPRLMQQSNPRLVHHGQYQNQPSPLQLQQQLQLRSYDEDLSALHSDYLPWRFFFFLQCEALSAFGLSRRDV